MKKTISSFDLAYMLNMEIDVLEDMLDGNNLHTEDDVYSLDLPSDAKQRLDLYFDSQPKVTGKQRKDIQGFFYNEQPKTVTVKPEPVWEMDDYLPDLEYCLNYQYDEFTDRELVDCREKLAYDLEIFGNYTLIAFKGVESGKQCFIELSENHVPNYRKLAYLMDNKEFVSFNGIKFDLPIMTLFLAGKSTAELWRATEMLIVEEMRPYEVLRHFGVHKREIDQIDLIEVAPLKGSLKLYGARLHCDTIQDLPFKAGISLSKEQIAIVKRYCLNDLDVTILLHNELRPQIKLREEISKQYKIDCRSKADSQIAEAVIKTECELFLGRKIERKNDIVIDYVKYDIPSFIKFDRDDLNSILEKIKNEKFYLESGYLQAGIMNSIQVDIGGSTVAMSIGGIHSCEKSVSYYADDEYMIVDIDSTSFYPSIIITQKLVPEQLGDAFLTVYSSAKEKRVTAKKEGDKVTDATYKILLNSSFGKFGNKFSVLYTPKLLLQTTLTGQLSLLMIAEKFEKANFLILQQNTDGLCIKLKRSDSALLESIVKQWEIDTAFNMEYVYYKSIHSRDVNNYYSVKDKGGIKRKGAYAEESLSKNPLNNICADAVAEYLLNKTPIDEYINQCNDILKFITVRNVKGGGCKDGEFLGKTIRWYHSKSTNSPIVYANSGNLVPTSDRCRPLQKLNKSAIDDVDKLWYISEAYSILQDIGVKNGLTL